MNNYNNRYGFDLLSVFMIFIALILNIFPVTRIFSFILLILSFYRAFSKKYYKRRQEYNVFYTYCNKLFFGCQMLHFMLKNTILNFNNVLRRQL